MAERIFKHDVLGNEPQNHTQILQFVLYFCQLDQRKTQEAKTSNMNKMLSNIGIAIT
jgi:hypothetical protein